LEAHEHSYERLWPVYNETVYSHNYTNPLAPVHLISGTAGCNEADWICVNPMLGPKGPWSAFRDWFPGTHGFGTLQAINSTHLIWNQFLAWIDGPPQDSVTIIQNNHGSRTI